MSIVFQWLLPYATVLVLILSGHFILGTMALIAAILRFPAFIKCLGSGQLNIRNGSPVRAERSTPAAVRSPRDSETRQVGPIVVQDETDVRIGELWEVIEAAGRDRT